jgi:MerR family transcriptional regulator, copper efflux regulator
MPSRTISQAAREAGVHVETIRYYERIGLLARRKGRSGGYRIYTDEEVETIRFVRRCRNFGFTLREIGEMRALFQDDSATCADVCAHSERKLAEIDSKVRELQAIREALQRALECRSAGRRARDCLLLLEC